MPKIKLSSNGHLRLSGSGKFLRTSEAVAAGGTLTMALNDFKASWSTARPVIQRKAGTIVGDVPVLFYFTGVAPSNVQARVVRAVGGAVVTDWATLASISISGTTGLGTLLNVPQGDRYLIQIRDGSQPFNAATTANGVQQWGVGVCLLGMGQSNMVGTFAAGSYADIVPGTTLSELAYFASAGACGSIWDDAGFHGPSGGPSTGNGPTGSSNAASAAGGTLSIIRIISKGLEAQYGYKVPVCLTPWAYGSTGIAQYFPQTAGSLFNVLLGKSGTAPNQIGGASPKNYTTSGGVITGFDFEGVFWHQGENNQSGTRAAYLASLKSLYEGLLAVVAPFGRTAADLFFAPAILGVYASQTGIEKIRGAVLDLEVYAAANGWPKVRAGWNCIDLDPTNGGDGLHFSDSPVKYKVRSARRVAQTCLYWLGCSTYSGLGPRLSQTATRSGNVATLTVLHDGGTALSTSAGGAPSGFYANTAADFGGAAIAVTAAIVGNTIQVTFPGGTTYPAYVKYMGGPAGAATSYHPDISNAVYDNVTYPQGTTGTDLHTGLPLVPTPDAITIN